jgi:RNA polymerase sigma factor (sigma-70 family)
MAASYDDKELFNLFREDETEKAFKQFCRQYWKMFVHLVVSKYRGSREEANDLMVDVYLILLDKLKRNDKFELRKGKLSTYLYGIARNQYINRIKENVKERIIFTYFDNNMEDLFLEIEKASDRQNDLEKEIKRAVDDLKQPCSTLLEGYYYHNLSYQQLADLLDYSSSNVAKVRKFKCMERLKSSCLERLKNYF